MRDVEALTGLSAGKICYANIDNHDPIIQSAIQAAENLWESCRSAWTLEEIWQDGTTIWISPKGSQQAVVAPDGFFNLIFLPKENEY